MGGLIEAASVVRVAVVRGEPFDAPGCALASEVSNTCSPINRVGLTNADDLTGASTGRDANVFAVITRMTSRAMCSPGSEDSIVSSALDAETEKAAGMVLWGLTGDNAGEVSLTSPSVSTVVAGATPTASVSAALQEFWSVATGIGIDDTIVHLGVSRLLEMSNEVKDGELRNLGIRVVTSPGYPHDGIAVTGPIQIELGPDEVSVAHDHRVNDTHTEANRLGALKFDPCTAVRVA